jgi:polyhydroxyalkanoate synthase
MLSQVPLQTYLGMLMMRYASSTSALQVLRRGSLNLNPELAGQAKQLQQRVRGKNQQELENELQNQLQNKFTELLSVVKSLNEYKYIRTLADAPISWQEGSTTLYDYQSEDDTAPVVIFIPSLINKSYILDLSEKRSFLRYLQRKNIHSYLVDWGEPQHDELGFNLDDYITGRLDKIINHVFAKTNKKIFLAGYCMGGLMATACAIRHPDKLQGMALFATPWDFHVKEFARFDLTPESLITLEKVIDSSDKISANIIQSMFYYLHPNLVTQKFDSFFSCIDDTEKEVEEFMALEYWVNDGIAMTRAVGRECFINWVQHNKVMNGQWQVAGHTVNPCEIDVPVFFSVANKDHIVPKSSSAPLMVMFANKEVIMTDTGHVSMIAGSRAEKLVWERFEEWVKRN